jgi:hypothetical protein
MHIRRPKPRITTQIPQITLDRRRLELVTNHKILEVYLDSQLNWGRHISEVKKRAAKKLSLLICPANKNWGADQETLIKVHQMSLLSSLEYGCNVYGAARNAQLKKLKPIHNQGLRIAIGAFCINKIKNLLCEAAMMALNHKRMIKGAFTTVRISSRPEHPMRTTLTETEEYNNYAV